MPVLTLVDTLGIQSFVFASNRLKDIAGGSWLIDQATATRGWISELGYQNHLLVGAGGNLLLKFAGETEAKQFAARFSRKVIDTAPGLEVAIVHEEYTTGRLASAIRRVQIAIEREKLERRPGVPLLGLGVTATCRETQLPATATDPDAGVPLAAGVVARRAHTDKQDQRWRELLLKSWPSFSHSQGPRIELAFPRDLDELGRSRGDTSLMGVVHIDGNGIGQKIKQWLEKCIEDGTTEATVAEQYRDISHKLAALAENALQAIVRRVIGAITWNSQPGRYELHSTKLKRSFVLPTDKAEKKLFLPLRPILLGGDDLTFVCDGRIALDLAATALAQFENATIPHLSGSVRACAGVALIKTHTPFARAYDLAENLCVSAKKYLRDKNLPDDSALDWHIGFSSPTETLSDLRRRQYAGDTLTYRPYRLGRSPEPGTWKWLADVMLGTQGNGFHAVWQTHRSKLKALREIAADGSQAVEEAMKAWQVAHRHLVLPDGMQNGFIGPRTPLLDAIELLDVHFSLDQ